MKIHSRLQYLMDIIYHIFVSIYVVETSLKCFLAF